MFLRRMTPPVCSPRRACFGLAFLAALLSLCGCQNYYIPPPPVAVAISPGPGFASNFLNVPLATLDTTTNQVQPGTQQFAASVFNAKDTTVTWSIVDPTSGLILPNGERPDGTTPFGRVDSTGLYTAPPVMPPSNTFAVQATSVADIHQSGQVGVELIAPTPTVSSVTILNSSGTAVAAMTEGGSYLLDLKGTFFYPSTVVTLGGGSAGAVQVPANSTPPLAEIKVPVTVQSSGLLPLQVANSTAVPGNPTPLVAQPASPAGTSALAVIVESVNVAGTTAPANKIYVPQTSAGTLAVMNGDAGARLRDATGLPVAVALPAGFAPTIAAANPAHDQVVALSSTVNQLVVVDAIRDTVVAQYSLPIAATATFRDQTCGVCAALVDSRRNQAILSTANGYFTVDLATGAASTPIVAPPAENFAYDPATRRIFAPFSGANGSGLDIINLASSSVATYELPAGSGFTLGSTLDAAALDPLTLFAAVADPATSEYVGINFEGAQPNGGTLSASAVQFQITSACNGDWDGVAIEAGSHLGFFGNNGACLGVASLPSAPSSAAPLLPNQPVRWAQLGLSPDGIAWTNIAEPHGETVFVGLSGTVYGVALRQDQQMLVRVDLAALQAASTLPGGADANQADISVTPSPVLFVPMH